MRVLLASPYGGVPGGMTRWTEHILNYYHQSKPIGIEVDLLPMGRKSFVNINSSIFYRLKCAVRDYRDIIKEFKEKIKSTNYDVMHLASSASISLLKDIYMLRYAQKKGIKTCIHFHFGRIPELKRQNNWEWSLIKKVVLLADKTIVLDKKSYDELRNSGFKNIEILPNPVAPIVNQIVLNNNDIKREPNTLLFTGHVVKTKGVFELIDACNNIPNIKLKIIGHVEPSMKETLQTRCKQAKQVDITGEMPYEEVIKEMLRCDLFVLPTYTEGFPNVILESMACGCAIVTTKVGAIPEMLQAEGDKKFGVLIDPQNTGQLQNAIANLIKDNALKEQCKKNVKKRVIERYNIDKIWTQLTHIWESTK